MLKPIVLGVIALVAAVAGYVWVSDVLTVDACLDSGGAWDHDKDICRQR